VQLKPNLYEVKLKGSNVAHYELMVDHYLAINPGHLDDDLEGFATYEPAFGMSAKWIVQNYKELAELKGYTVVEPAAVMATHLPKLSKHMPQKFSPVRMSRTSSSGSNAKHRRRSKMSLAI